MIKLLVDALMGNGMDIGVLRLVNYLSFRVIMGMVTSLLFALTVGFRFIVFLYRKKL
ncbi:MAG: phospho-N-acetylmuramoyl-pentapeptide-transferase, partial [Acidobacteria bacterium]